MTDVTSNVTSPLYNLGLVYKYRRSWQQSLEYNRRALGLDPENEAAIWNLGIAATALGDWHTARKAWRDYGIDVPEGDGPIDLPCGTAPVRLNPGGDAEVVWSRRVDPARAVISSIPYAESGHGWRDLVLNDGAANGYRLNGDREVPVFDELQHLKRSRFGTFVARVILPDPSFDTDRLCELGDGEESSVEDWTTNTQVLCKQCSEGRPHSKHDQDLRPPPRTRTIAIATSSLSKARLIAARWCASVPGIEVESLETALQPGPVVS